MTTVVHAGQRGRQAGLALRWRAVGAAALATGAVVLAVFGQVRLDVKPEWWGDAVVCFALAALMWVVALWLAPSATAVADHAMPIVAGPPLSRDRRRWLIAGLALVALTAVLAPLTTGPQGGGLGLLAYPNVPAGWVGPDADPTNTFTRAGAWLWLVGMAMYTVALAERGRRRVGATGSWSTRGIQVRLSWAAVAVLAITLVGAWFRFHDLAGVPLEMTSDHTEKVLDVADVVDGLRPVYLPHNAGREPLEFYWLALLVALGVPNGFMLLKLGMAIVSTLNIPLIYLLGKRVAGREVGLLAALALALSYWHVVITRIGLRIAFSPLFVTLTLYFLYRALQTGRRNDFLLLGASLAAGLYGYSGYRPMFFFVPLAIVLKLAHDAWRRRRAGETAPLLPRAVAGHLLAAAGLALLVMAPMLRFAVDRPATFWGRTMTRMGGAEKAMDHPLLEQLAINVKNGLLMFNYTSDNAWFQAAPFKPALDVVGGGLLVLALLTVLWRLLRYQDWRTGLLLLVIPLLLLSSIMALSFPNENPSFTRAAGALPAVCLLVVLPLPALRRMWRGAFRSAGTLVYLAVLAGLTVVMLRSSWQRYFVTYASNYDSSTQNTADGARVAASFQMHGVDLDHTYLVGWSNGWDYRALGTLLGNPRWKGVLWGADDSGADAVTMARAHVDDPAPKLYISGGDKGEADADYLKDLYPSAVVARHASRVPGKEFWTVFVPARPAGGSGG